MSEAGLQAATDKMRAAGVDQTAIDVFAHHYRHLSEGATGLIPEADIEPLLDADHLDGAVVDDEAGRQALARTAMVKLNGGLGTSMGLDRAKTLLPVREGRTFLDLIVGQVLAARRRWGVRLPLLLMNSFRTEDDTVAALACHPELAVDGLPLTFLQNSEPKLRADDLTPVDWPADPTLEWCPPGHGDLFTVLHSRGIVAALLAQGFRYLSVSNGDNLGAAPDPRLAGWFAASGAPYAAELCRRTANDRKGGHLARRRADGRLVLRDTAMVVEGEMDLFTDELRHPYFHTNNLWFDLEALQAMLAERDGVLALPLIRNRKTVDPADRSSTPVIQIETGMGTAIELFDGATAVVVGRDRFLPVKTTNELLLVRSDLFELDELERLVARTPSVPEVRLDTAHYGLMADFDARVPVAPSLVRATSLHVAGDWAFEPGTTVVGSVSLPDLGGSRSIGGEVSAARVHAIAAAAATPTATRVAADRPLTDAERRLLGDAPPHHGHAG